MPRYPGSPAAVAQRHVSATFIDFAGRKSTVGVDSIALDSAGVIDFQNSIADLSNAALVARQYTEGDAHSPSNVTTFDEAYASIADKLVLVFQNNDLDNRRISVPAPDASLFGADGQTAIEPDVTAAVGSPARSLFNAVAAITAALGGSFTYVGGYLSSKSRTSVGLSARPGIAEPEAGDVPGEGPGDNPTP